MAAPTESDDLASTLHGQTVTIPNLWPLFDHWPVELHQLYRVLKSDIDDELDRSVPPKYKSVVDEANPTLLASFLWPKTSRDRLYALTHFVIWMGTMDDYLESLKADTNKINHFSDSAKKFIEQCLGFQDSLDVAPPTKSILANFETVVQPIRSIYDKDQRWELRSALYDYLDSTRLEQQYARSGRVPRYESYLLVRNQTGGGSPLEALAEFASESHLPTWARRSALYLNILESVRLIIALTNDLLSLKKELRNGSTFSAIPIVYSSTAGSLDEAVRFVVKEIQEKVAVFDTCSAKLLAQAAKASNGDRREIGRVLETLQFNCTGNLRWSQNTKRYGAGPNRVDGGLDVKLMVGDLAGDDSKPASCGVKRKANMTS